MFEESREAGAKQTIYSFLADLKDQGRPFELRQLVQNHLERAGHFGGAGDAGNSATKTPRFGAQATRDLERVIASDRLSILSDSQDNRFARNGIESADISPRAAIPDDVRVLLVRQGEGEFVFQVEAQVEDDWVRARSLDQVEEWIKNGLIPTSGCLSNLKQSMRCAVVAIEGEARLFQAKQLPSKQEPEKVRLRFFPVDRRGDVDDDEVVLRQGRLRLLAINPNVRYLRLLSHIKEKVQSSNLPQALRHFIGQGDPEPVFYELETTVPTELETLNEDQRSAGHPLCLKTAGEVAGPPGTGKTKTISELVRALLRCTVRDIVVLSERNGAIDAIAEKFASLCVKTVGSTKKVTNMSMWKDIVTFGSVDAMGEYAKLFLIEEKVKYHPEILEAAKKEKECKDACQKLRRKMQELIADEIQGYGDKFNDDLAWNQHSKIRRSNDDNLASATLVLDYTRKVKAEAENLLTRSVAEDLLDDFIESNSALMRNLFPLNFDKTQVMRRLRDIVRRLGEVLQSDLFDEAYVEALGRRHTDAQQERQVVEERVKQELSTMSRLKMSTIGSSHKLFGNREETDEDDMAERFGQLAVNDDQGERDGAIVIFDESGCIPSYELLGLSRLDCPIAAILCVGDKKQLPPYDPSSSSGPKGRFRQEREVGLKSLLDVCEVKKIVPSCPNLQYKNQQREIQFQLKRRPIPGITEASVLTIDQCQGQEADVVLFTLVQKPTRFLNKNRLNVAMSRTRGDLVFVADRIEFRKASEDPQWECNLMAQDVLDQTRVM